MTTRAFFKMCLVLIFLNTIVEKNTLNPEITLFYQFYAQKALFKVPKICNINLWIENERTKDKDYQDYDQDKDIERFSDLVT